jgi:hypothetical protein
MIDFKILCTGNPETSVIACAVKQVFPQADFATKSVGYDLRMWDPADEEYFKKQIINYNVLINASFIANGAQQKILEITKDCWSSGHVFNIGSTAEYEGRNSYLPHYSVQKRALRDMSLSLCSQKFKTTHITIGRLNDVNTVTHLDPVHIAKAIEWILKNEVNIPIIGIEKFSQ